MTHPTERLASSTGAQQRAKLFSINGFPAKFKMTGVDAINR